MLKGGAAFPKHEVFLHARTVKNGPNVYIYIYVLQIFSAMAMVSDETSFQWKIHGFTSPSGSS